MAGDCNELADSWLGRPSRGHFPLGVAVQCSAHQWAWRRRAAGIDRQSSATGHETASPRVERELRADRVATTLRRTEHLDTTNVLAVRGSAARALSTCLPHRNLEGASPSWLGRMPHE